jgi:Ig-fold domain
MRRYLYKDVIISASSDARVFFKNDNPFAPLNAKASVSFLHLATGTVTNYFTTDVQLPVGGGAMNGTCIDQQNCNSWDTILPNAGCTANGTDCIVLLNLTDANTGALIADNFELLMPFGGMTFPSSAQVNLQFVVGSPNPDQSVPITITTDAVALFVTFTTLAQGRFSDNAIIALPGQTIINFIPWGALDLSLLTSTIRVEHVATYGVV